MKKLLMISLLTTLLFSCKHDKVEIAMPYIEPPCWQKFVGNYIVYDTMNQITYNMSIIHKDSIQTQLGYANIDSLIITNFGNKFDLRYGFICGSDPYRFKAVAPFPCYDHNNKKWSLTCHTDDPSTPVIENRLNNDTIILYFKLDNIAFFSTDGVPYFSGYLKHIAVKQH